MAQHPRHGDPLAFAPGQVSRARSDAIGEADRLEGVGGAVDVERTDQRAQCGPGAPRAQTTGVHVVDDSQRRREGARLGDDAEATTVGSPMSTTESGDPVDEVGVEDVDPATGGRDESGAQIDQARLAGAALTDEGDTFAVLDGQIDAGQCRDVAVRQTDAREGDDHPVIRPASRPTASMAS